MSPLRKLVGAAALAAVIALSACTITPTPNADPPPAPAGESQENGGLAETVQANLDKAFPDGIPTDDVLYALTEIEDVSDGTIRVYIQYDLSDAEREQAADEVHGLGYDEDLEVVVIRDASGLDSNHFYY